MSVQRIAGRYAKSLLDLAKEQNKLDRVLEDIKSFKAASENKDLFLLLKSPVVSASKKLSIIDALFGDKYDELTMAFLRIIVRKGREPYLPETAATFIDSYKSLNHISTVKVTSAKPLSADSLNALVSKLQASDATDQKVEIETAVDPSIIGGLILEIDDKIYDASVTQKLEDLKRSFK